MNIPKPDFSRLLKRNANTLKMNVEMFHKDLFYLILPPSLASTYNL